jgi:hypothetical protein
MGVPHHQYLRCRMTGQPVTSACPGTAARVTGGHQPKHTRSMHLFGSGTFCSVAPRSAWPPTRAWGQRSRIRTTTLVVFDRLHRRFAITGNARADPLAANSVNILLKHAHENGFRMIACVVSRQSAPDAELWLRAIEWEERSNTPIRRPALAVKPGESERWRRAVSAVLCIHGGGFGRGSATGGTSLPELAERG